MDIQNEKLQPGSFLARRDNILLVFISGRDALRAVVPEIGICRTDDALSGTLEKTTFCGFRTRRYFQALAG